MCNAKNRDFEMHFLFYGVLFFGQFCVVRSQSPCPDIFEYKTDGFETYGVIHMKPFGKVSSVDIRANFTIATRVGSSYVGKIEPFSSSPLLLHDFNRGVPIDYKVSFPVTSPLPRLTALVVNGNVICYGAGDIPGPSQYVTTTSLLHTLFLKDQGPGYFEYQPPPPVKPQNEVHQDPQPDLILDYIGPLHNNEAQVFTFEEDGDRFGSWNSITYTPPQKKRTTLSPSYYPGPVTRPSQQSRPDVQYYPEVITHSPPPVLQPLPQRPLEPYSPQPRPTPTPPQSSAPSPIQCGVVAGGNERQPLIYNGQTYNRGDWPWLVAIYRRKDGSLSFICSGTLVSDRHVVTAAHCMRQKNTFSSKRDIVVKVGVYNLEDWGDDVTVTRTLASATIHEHYNASSLANDILVLTFSRSVEFNTNIRPACLWNGNTELSSIVGASGVVAGWGQSETSGAGKGEPRVVRMPIVSTAVCRASRPDFHKLTSSNTLCAGDRNGSGPCLGDSGGGFYLLEGGRWQLRGVVSLSLRPDSGDSTCNLSEYIVFTDSAQYLDWIRNTMAR